METTSTPLVHTASTLATRVADLWHSEEAIGHRLDAWLLHHVRDAGEDMAHEASLVRRGYHRARRDLRAHLRDLGRQTVSLPVVGHDAAAAAGPDAAARGLQRLHRDLTRANDNLNRLSRMATLRREHPTAAVLDALHEAQLDTLELVRDLFQLGQRRSREALQGAAA